jgi:multicomponent Na+:H+ antiporter subunit C
LGVLLAITVGVLFAAAVYLLLRRSLLKLVLGLVLIGHAANLLIFSSVGVRRGRPPLIDEGQTALAAPYTDPLPPALILTAIVIGFAVTAFAIVLLRRAYQEIGSDDLDDMRATEQ